MTQNKILTSEDILVESMYHGLILRVITSCQKMNGMIVRQSLAELEGDELESNLQSLQEEDQWLLVPTAYAEILKKKTMKEWAAAESSCCLGYNGLSDHTGCCHVQKTREREEE